MKSKPRVSSDFVMDPWIFMAALDGYMSRFGSITGRTRCIPIFLEQLIHQVTVRDCDLAQIVWIRSLLQLS
jgi:hypothetical protein